MHFTSICVFCGSRKGNNPLYEQTARQLGYLFAEKNIRLVYGAGKVGLMGVMADACLERGGQVTGVIPHFLRRWEVCHEGLTELVLVDTLFERKVKMAELSQATVSLPGGYGTLDELFEMVTLVQLRQLYQPVGLLNINGYFDPLLSQIRHMYEEGFMSEFHYRLIQVADNLEELLQKMSDWMEDNPENESASPDKWGKK